MRLRNRLLRERLQRVRERANSARATLATVRVEASERPFVSLPPPLPALAEVICGRGCDWIDQAEGRRRTARNAVSGEILVRRLGSFGFQVRLRDLSLAGCQIELIDMVDLNDHVITRLPGLEPLGATVSWVDDRSAGLHFDRPIHPAVFELLLARLA